MSELADRQGVAATRVAGAAQGITIALVSVPPMLVMLIPPPVLPSMVAHFQNIPSPASTLSTMVALPGLLVAIFSWFAGSLIDRHGRRKPFVLAAGLFAVFGMLPAVIDSFAVLAISRVAIGIAQAIIMVAGSALLIDYFTEQQRRVWLTAQGVGAAVLQPGVVVLAGVVGSYGWQNAFFLYGLAIPIWACAYLFCFEPKAQAADPSLQADIQPFPKQSAVLVGAIALIASVFFFVFVIHAGFIMKGLGVESPTQIGNLIGLTTLGFPLGVVIFNIGSRKMPINAVLALMILLMSIATLGIGFSRNTTELVAFGLLQQVGGGMSMPILIFWVAELFRPEHRGRGFGILNGCFFLGQFLCAPVLNGAEIATGGIQPAFVALGIAGIAGAGLTFFITRSRRAPGLGAPAEQAA